MKQTVLSLREVLDGALRPRAFRAFVLDCVSSFCKSEEIDMKQDADKIALILHENGDITISALCGKSFQEAMRNGEFDA